MPKIKMWIISHSEYKEYLFPTYLAYSLNISYVGLVWCPWDLMCMGNHEPERKMLSPKTLTFLLGIWPIVCDHDSITLYIFPYTVE